MQAILPPAMLGILGGGQLGRMFVSAAKRMGYRVTVLDPDAQAPAAEFADVHLCAAYNDAEALRTLAASCAAITTEFEHVNADAMRELAKTTRVSPSGDCVAIAQDRIAEKAWVNKAGLPTAPYLAIESVEDIQVELAPYLPGILKTARLGYDGKGQVRVNSADEARAAYANLGGQACVLEKMLDLKLEVSAIVTRVSPEQFSVFPVAENIHKNGILDESIVPARIAPALAAQAQQMARQLAEALDYVGVLAVEFFVLADDSLVINEIAPRPHNSGHYTIEACSMDQFDAHIRGIAGWPLPKPKLLSPAVMVNVLGQHVEPTRALIATHPEWNVHDYGKAEVRHDRKMGHITVLTDNPDATVADLEATGCWDDLKKKA